MEEVVYSAESQLRSPARFAADTWADLRVSPGLAWRLFLHTLRANYRRSWLGYLWLLAPPLATTATWVFLSAARVLNVGATETPYTVYVLTGTMLWQVFADAINSPLQQLSNARAILTKSRVPRGLALAVGFWFFLTPVIYTWPSGGRAALLAKLNPVAPLLEAMRGWLTTGRTAPAREFLLVVALTLPVLLTAWLLQRLARPHIIARLG